MVVMKISVVWWMIWHTTECSYGHGFWGGALVVVRSVLSLITERRYGVEDFSSMVDELHSTECSYHS